MQEFEHNNELSIPKNISKYCVYTGQIFLFNMFLAYSKKLLLIASALIILHITTTLHWKEPYKKGWIRTIDITTVWTTFVILSYYIYYHVDPYYHTQCLLHFCFVIFIYVLNETLYYYQVTEKVYLPEIKKEDQTQYHPFHYFSLRYTYPNTIERENAYKRSVFTHCVFVHLWMSISIMYYVYYHSIPAITNA